MTDSITAADAITMAIALEQAGQEFYEALALGCGSPKVAALCARLAVAEAEHAGQFRQMRQRLSCAGRPVADAQAVAARARVRREVIPPPVVVHQVGMDGRLEDALDMGIRMEQDSIRFYEAMQTEGQTLEDAAILRAIIEQENQHLSELKALRT